MKMLRYPVIAAAAGFLISSASQAWAGGHDSCCDDGIAASPKVRAALNDQCMSRCATQAQSTASTTARQTDLADPPKVQQMRNERATGAITSVQNNENAAYRPTGSDGVTASPKVRSQLDERRQTVEIAPLK